MLARTGAGAGGAARVLHRLDGGDECVVAEAVAQRELDLGVARERDEAHLDAAAQRRRVQRAEQVQHIAAMDMS